MPDRVPSDHPSVHSVRARLARAGRTDRPRVEVPAEERDRFPEDVVRLVVDGTERFTRVEAAFSGDGLELRGAFGTPDGARNPDEGTDHLPDWQADHGVEFGGAVLVDVVDADYRYGLRAPGERQLYDTGGGDSELQDLATDLLDDE
jgi:hypothetical protein